MSGHKWLDPEGPSAHHDHDDDQFNRLFKKMADEAMADMDPDEIPLVRKLLEAVLGPGNTENEQFVAVMNFVKEVNPELFEETYAMQRKAMDTVPVRGHRSEQMRTVIRTLSIFGSIMQTGLMAAGMRVSEAHRMLSRASEISEQIAERAIKEGAF